MAAIAARLVRTPDAVLAYKIVIDHDDLTVTEQAVASVREGEVLIREALAHLAAPWPRCDAWNPPLICGDSKRQAPHPRPLQGA